MLCSKHLCLPALMLTGNLVGFTSQQSSCMMIRIKTLFEHIISHHVAPELTFDKLDAFTGKKSGKHIINLTSTNPSHEYSSLIGELRAAAIEAGAQLEDYRLHVTLGRIHSSRASLDTVQKIVSSVRLEPFSVILKNAIFKYLDGEEIDSWAIGTNDR